MRMRCLLMTGVAAAALLNGTTASASENVTYTYDALGRLVATTRTGGPSGGVTMGTTFDPAGNRTSYTISGSPSSTPTPTPGPTPTPTPTPTPGGPGSGSPLFIVVPLAGFSLIPVPQVGI